MSLRFGRRVLFIKDVIGSSEICCWTFYGHGRKVAEVCCHSIVYTTDKKHTKVISNTYKIYLIVYLSIIINIYNNIYYILLYSNIIHLQYK